MRTAELQTIRLPRGERRALRLPCRSSRAGSNSAAASWRRAGITDDIAHQAPLCGTALSGRTAEPLEVARARSNRAPPRASPSGPTSHAFCARSARRSRRKRRRRGALSIASSCGAPHRLPDSIQRHGCPGKSRREFQHPAAAPSVQCREMDARRGRISAGEAVAQPRPRECRLVPGSGPIQDRALDRTFRQSRPRVCEDAQRPLEHSRFR